MSLKNLFKRGDDVVEAMAEARRATKRAELVELNARDRADENVVFVDGHFVRVGMSHGAFMICSRKVVDVRSQNSTSISRRLEVDDLGLARAIVEALEKIQPEVDEVAPDETPTLTALRGRPVNKSFMMDEVSVFPFLSRTSMFAPTPEPTEAERLDRLEKNAADERDGFKLVAGHYVTRRGWRDEFSVRPVGSHKALDLPADAVLIAVAGEMTRQSDERAALKAEAEAARQADLKGKAREARSLLVDMCDDADLDGED